MIVIFSQLAGCSKPRTEFASSSERPRRGGELRLSEDPDLRSWDPLEASDVVTASIIGPVYEGLLRYDPYRPERLLPALAIRCDTLDGGATYRLALRKARFADDPCFTGGRGRFIRASDVRFTLERALTTKPLPEMLSLVWKICGARSLADGSAPHLEGLETEGDSIVAFHLCAPSVSFPHFLASNAAWLVAPEAVAVYGRDLWQHPVGCGPFRLGFWDPVRRVILVRNENYWEADSLGISLPYLDRVNLSLALSDDPLQGRKQHVLRTLFIGPEARAAFAFGEYRYLETQRFNTIFLSWNLDRPSIWSRNRDLRRAILLAGFGWNDPHGTVPARGLLPPGIAGYSEDDGITPDPEAARRILAACGHPQGRGLPALELEVIEGEEFYVSRLAERLAPLGIDVRGVSMSRPEHWMRVAAGKVDFFRNGWIADYPDAENFFEVFSSESPRNLSHFRNAAYDALFLQLTIERDAAARARLSARLEAILIEEAPAIFICHEMAALLVSPEVHGFEPSMGPLSRRFYQYVWLSGAGGGQ